MPDQALLEQLDVLRQDTQSQQKTVNSQLTALKNTTAAFKDALSALQTDPVDVIKLDHAYTVLSKAEVDSELLAQLESELEAAQAVLGNVFGAALHEALAELGLEMGGQSPRFHVGRFEIFANFVSRKVTLNYGKNEIAKNIPLSVERVIKAYQTQVKAIAGRNEDGKAWIEQFHEAYQIARKLSEKPTTRVNITECYWQLVMLRQSRAFALEPSKRTLSDYSRAQFLYDLAAFRTPNLHIHSANKSQAESPAKSMWFVQGNAPHDGSYVADIEFKDER